MNGERNCFATYDDRGAGRGRPPRSSRRHQRPAARAVPAAPLQRAGDCHDRPDL